MRQLFEIRKMEKDGINLGQLIEEELIDIYLIDNTLQNLNRKKEYLQNKGIKNREVCRS
jgi:hypothetical protein